MKIELHGTGFEAFELPKYIGGLIVTDDEDEIRNDGKYPVKAINMITVLTSGHLYVGVDLRKDDEHLPQPDKKLKEVAA